MKKLDQSFWENRWVEGNTQWDIGQVSPPLKEIIDSLEDKNIRILIPGAGGAHEVIYLWEHGLKNVFVCDWAISAFENLFQKAPDFPKDQCLVCDFFDLNIEVDLILEQTFFCAIHPSLRPKYAEKTAELLSENGVLTGLFFASNFGFEGPPFGGYKEEYIAYFELYFTIDKIEIANNSILPRQGNELSFKFVRL
jgi:hypothetical protein